MGWLLRKPHQGRWRNGSLWPWQITENTEGRVNWWYSELFFRDPNRLRAGELHSHFEYWQYIAQESPSPQQATILGWIRDKVSIQQFRHFKGSFRGESYDSDKPPIKAFENNVSCKSLVTFVENTLIARLKSGAISLLGKAWVGVVEPPFIVLPPYGWANKAKAMSWCALP